MTQATSQASRPKVMVDGNEAVADVAYRLNEVIAIYPITPSTPMGESSDAWSAKGQPNIWGSVPQVMEMQSEGGAAGAVHGSLQAGALTTTFTASQGLLLMIPNMYKIAGELTSTVFHVAARSLAAQGLSIFGDHSDVMATRATGFAQLASGSVQEAHDMALIAQAASLEARLPFLHFFDGFRTSHEIGKVERLDDADLRHLIDDDLVRAHRGRALSPDRPFIRGTAQNPDVYFQARETVNPFYAACPGIVQQAMDRFAARVGRAYRLFDYAGAPDAERVIVIMGSGAETAVQTALHLAEAGDKVGVITVRLYRPFSVEHFVSALPPTVRAIAALDRTKEPGAAGEPLYQDLVTAIDEATSSGVSSLQQRPRVVGGRYGLSSKEFTPAMVKGVFELLAAPQLKNHFTVGIHDDLSGTSIDYDPSWSIERPETVRAVFFGLGSDGTVGANKNAIKIIGEETDNHAQGYFVYDSKKSGAITVSHLRFGPRPIHAPYLIGERQASFVACHQFAFLERLDMLKYAEPGAVFLLNSPEGPETVWRHLPKEVQQAIVDKRLRFYVIDAQAVAGEVGMGRRINTIMQTCFFALSGVLPRDEAIDAIKQAIRKTYGNRGEAVVNRNFAAVDGTLERLFEVTVPGQAEGELGMRPPISPSAPDFVRQVLGAMIAGQGDQLPVSALPNDGTYPSGTSRYEKRNIALEIPVWEPDLCIQCGKCVFVCPHAVIRQKVVEPAALTGAPETFLSAEARFKEFPGWQYTLQVAPEDCTGCSLCVEACPARDKTQTGRKAINMAPQPPIRERERSHWDFFLELPEVDRSQLDMGTIKNAQLLEPLFEFSGACAGCGETPYVKLLSQLFGDRALVANATGCSSIYGGNLPTTPWTHNAEGRGPAWSNSLFEDNAEFGLGMRLALDKQVELARELVGALGASLDAALATGILTADQSDEAGIAAQRARVARLKQALAGLDDPRARNLEAVADALVQKSVWIVGGDGWAYDIGYGGLDHVLASGRNVNVLVLDTEVYSNTGGQASKSTPLGAVAKFAAKGKALPKKDLGLMAMAYGYVYVAKVAFGAGDQHTLTAFREAEAFDGPSIIMALSPCIAHGYDLALGLQQQQKAVKSGAWQLYRFDPSRAARGEAALILGSRKPSLPVKDYAAGEARYRMLSLADPARAERLIGRAQRNAGAQFDLYEQLAALYAETGEREDKENGHG
ncbi:MAG: pyruvate:ferredoxin (flavodoxin) oxidoreductase [Chloroflexi bacterium]|nr:pyruvate:ferredoxin (flavodoxin) oxidoreductase [Chloroflexota bacterium]